MTVEEKVGYIMDRIDMDAHIPIFEEMVNDMYDYREVSLPLLIELVRDDDEDEKKKINAIYMIGRMGPYAAPAVATITKALSSPKSSNEIKAVSAGALGRIGAKASPSIPVLREHLIHEDSWVRQQAERALKTMGTKKALEVLAEHKAYLIEVEKHKALIKEAEKNADAEEETKASTEDAEEEIRD